MIAAQVAVFVNALAGHRVHGEPGWQWVIAICGIELGIKIQKISKFRNFFCPIVSEQLEDTRGDVKYGDIVHI